ncbi:hypothetical protein K2173_025980 [Erythroxylum novogranatense]|uniref:DDT domain-containing protein n=1 Tax=Erythroxylum novogranatense TaxID=1862640 RepID=A0AAV8SIB8_9ROSI|nr:hypothetical protein K2173_025980 [Erythroxylum novogranatense]
MAVTSDSVEVSVQTVRKSRSKCPGVRVVHGKIYDSEKGKTCHQCRQKTMDFMATCKNQKVNKQCPINYCRKCLMNRYGENAEEVSLKSDWICPKCRDVCNCSFCMKRKGHKPTGILVHTAKGQGFSSVLELLSVSGPQNLDRDKILANEGASPIKLASSIKVVSGRKTGKENSMDGKNDLNLNIGSIVEDGNPEEIGSKKLGNVGKVSDKKRKRKRKEGPSVQNTVSKEELKIQEGNEIPGGMGKDKTPVLFDGTPNASNCINGVSNMVNPNDLGTGITFAIESCKINACTAEVQSKKIEPEIQLPPGTCLTTVAGTEFSAEDVGDALQFLEFCISFGKALELKKGQAEAVLQEIINGRKLRRSQYSLVARFNILLLSLIHQEIGEEPPSLSPTKDQKSWLQALGECVSDCGFMSNEYPSDCFVKGNQGYDGLSASKKLKLLIFLCDEALNTLNLRSWIDDQQSKYKKEKKESREKIIAAKRKEKHMKQKMQDEVAKAIIAKTEGPLSVSEYEAIVSQIKSAATQAHAERIEAMNMMSKKIQRSDAVRTDRILLDADGHAFWRLAGYDGHSSILLQDMGTSDADKFCEKWFVYDAEEHEKEIEKYFSFLRLKRSRLNRTLSGS